MPPNTTTTLQPTRVAPSGVTFWLLLMLGFAALAPCVLLPEWRAYQAARIDEQIHRQRAEAMASMVDAQHSALQRMQRDPSVLVRLAQRDLRYRRADHRPVSVLESPAAQQPLMINASDVLAAEVDAPVQLEPVQPPEWVSQRLRWLPAYDYDAVFCDKETRPVILTMSVGLIGLAMILFGRRPDSAGG
jgi:hypothetical protein